MDGGDRRHCNLARFDDDASRLCEDCSSSTKATERANRCLCMVCVDSHMCVCRYAIHDCHYGATRDPCQTLGNYSRTHSGRAVQAHIQVYSTSVQYLGCEWL